MAQNALDALRPALLDVLGEWMRQQQATPPAPALLPDPQPVISTAEFDPDRFYLDLLHALGEWQRRSDASPRGAVTVVKRVAMEHGVEVAARFPLPRLSRAELEDLGVSNSSYYLRRRR